MTISVGDSLQMSVSVSHAAEGEAYQVAWSTSDTAIVVTSTSGVVHAHRTGTAGVRATITNRYGTVVAAIATVHVE